MDALTKRGWLAAFLRLSPKDSCTDVCEEELDADTGWRRAGCTGGRCAQAAATLGWIALALLLGLALARLR